MTFEARRSDEARQPHGARPETAFRAAAAAGAAPSEHYFHRGVWRVEDFHPEGTGFRLAAREELPAAHLLAERIMGMPLAPLWALASVHAHTGGTCWVFDGAGEPAREGMAPQLTGIGLLLPLNWDGEAALRTRRFNSGAPRIDHLCAPGEEMAAIYMWLTAGSDRPSRRAMMQTIQAWLDGGCAGRRTYARGATDDGYRGCLQFGFRLLSPETGDLFIHDLRQ